MLSALARVKADFYGKIESLKVVELFTRYLTDSDERIRVKTLNLIGNMTKHSNFFISDFMKHNVIGSIVSTLNGGSH